MVKRILIMLVLCVALMSCSATYYEPQGTYEGEYTEEIYSDGQPTVNIIFTYGTPYYYGDRLYYYVYRGWYYYPYFYSGHWYYHRYHRPLPPPRWHRGGPARPGRPGSGAHPNPGHFRNRHYDSGFRAGSSARPRPEGSGTIRGGQRPSGNGGHVHNANQTRPTRPSGGTFRQGSSMRGGSVRVPSGHSGGTRVNPGSGRRH